MSRNLLDLVKGDTANPHPRAIGSDMLRPTLDAEAMLKAEEGGRTQHGAQQGGFPARHFPQPRPTPALGEPARGNAHGQTRAKINRQNAGTMPAADFHPPPGNRIEKAGAPSGFSVIPGGAHGGYRKMSGAGKWEYWYPDTASQQAAVAHHAARAERGAGDVRAVHRQERDRAAGAMVGGHTNPVDAHDMAKIKAEGALRPIMNREKEATWGGAQSAHHIATQLYAAHAALTRGTARTVPAPQAPTSGFTSAKDAAAAMDRHVTAAGVAVRSALKSHGKSAGSDVAVPSWAHVGDVERATKLITDLHGSHGVPEHQRGGHGGFGGAHPSTKKAGVSPLDLVKGGGHLGGEAGVMVGAGIPYAHAPHVEAGVGTGRTGLRPAARAPGVVVPVEAAPQPARRGPQGVLIDPRSNLGRK